MTGNRSVPGAARQVAVVTGGASGIGKAICLRAAREGYAVIILDCHDAGETIESILSGGGEAVCLRCDVGDAEAVPEAFSRIYAEYRTIDVLVNNAGTMGRWPLRIDETTEQDWQAVFDTNVKSVYLCCRSVLQSMRQRGRGNILNIASELALVGAEGCALYCASKAAVMHFTRSLAIDEARHGIRVNCICPGPVDTGLLSPTVADGGDAASARAASARSTLLNRLGSPTEIAELAWFVATGPVDFLVGSAIVADGGVTAI